MKSITGRFWKRPLPFVPENNVLRISKSLNLLPEIVEILIRRGINTPTEMESYLYPTLHDIGDPFSMKGMTAACKILGKAITEHEELLIWGDYDVDGVTATALLLRFFRDLSVRSQWYIPNRFTDGYGLNTSILEIQRKRMKSSNPVLVTVDCGIANYEEVAHAKSIGFQVIITDHHEPGDVEVEADAVLNPKQQGCEFIDKNVAGVGIAFYLALGLRAHLHRNGYFATNTGVPNMKKLLELVAIGTIADMVELKGGNRVMVKAGFEIIDSSPSPGVAALMKESNVHSAKITSEDIAFQLGPKLNAAGRLKDAAQAVELLIETDRETATRLAKKLDRLNTRRKEMCGNCLENTLEISRKMSLDQRNIVVIESDYSLGVLGIVASQLVEKIKKPVIIVTEVESETGRAVLKGSCRSTNGIDIHGVLKECEGYLIQYGGHKMAAGITLYKEMFDDFKKALNSYFNDISEIKPEFENVDVLLDAEKALSKAFVSQLQMLEPFGVGNNKPLFWDSNVVVHDLKRIGKTGDHILFNKRGKFEKQKCIGFNLGEYEKDILCRQDLDIVYSVAISRFKKLVSWQAQIVDLV